MSKRNTRLIGIFVAVALLLLIPLVVRFPWSAVDFITAGVLLLSAGLACEFVLRSVKKTGYRVAICAGILFLLFIIWAELAVGLIGTPVAGS